MTVYTAGNIHTDDLEVGDTIAYAWHRNSGPIVAIRPYPCGICHADGHAGEPCPSSRWRYARFANGVEVTMTPGSTWFPE